MTTLSVNSNYNSLAAANNFANSVQRYNDILTQISTGTSVTPRSDPAAFIASSLLESDILVANQAVRNAQMTNAVLSIADSGMSQISGLLQDARALSVASANTAALSPEMQNAYQQQMDAIVGSIDRISKTTNYMGVPLLDGSFSATAQLGTDVVSSQQVNIAIPDMSSSALGGKSGVLFDLVSNGSASLVSNPALANATITGALSQVLSSRAEIGAMQKYTLDASAQFMQDYMTQLVGTKSIISDTNYALAASNLARESILLGNSANALGLSNLVASNAAALLS
ncbi:MAG: flagellin [Thermoguttaceae bacterium]